jgi:tetratricopeptide (TPR) repeat protein
MTVRIAIVLGLLSACSAQTSGPSLEVAGLGSFGALAAEPDGSDGLSYGDYLAGSYALNVGYLDEAAVFFERALAADPDDPSLLRQVYLLTLAGGRYDQSLQLAERLVAQDASDDEAQLLIALDRARAGQFASARE